MGSESTLGILLIIFSSVVGFFIPQILKLVYLPVSDIGTEKSRIDQEKDRLISRMFLDIARTVEGNSFISFDEREIIKVKYNREIEALELLYHYSKEMLQFYRHLKITNLVGGIILIIFGGIITAFPAFSFDLVIYFSFSLFTAIIILALYTYVLLRGYRNNYNGIVDGIENRRIERVNTNFMEKTNERQS